MGTEVKGVVSRGTIRSWLEHYQALISEDKHPDDMPRNTGHKPDDGIPDALLNRIMLVQGLESMKANAWILYSCCRARWIDQDTLSFTLKRLGLSKDRYYKRCDWAVDYLYYKINGDDWKLEQLLRRSKYIDLW